MEKNKRLLEIDIVKGLAILFMFAVHIYEEYYIEELQDTGMLVHFVRFFGGPLAAPIFMLTMGICMTYTRHSTGKDFIKRGVSLFFIGIALQFVRDFIPVAIDAVRAHDKAIFYEAVDYLFSVDVLIFAGITFLLFGLFKLSKLSDRWLIVFYLICALANEFLLPIKIENKPLAYVTGLIWGSWENTWFPMCTWIFYPIAGYLLGKKLQACNDLDNFYKKTLTWSFMAFIPLLLIMFEFKIDCGALDGLFYDTYFQHNWFGNLIIFDLCMLWLSIWHFASENLPSIIKKTLIRWSVQLNTMYIIQWIILGYLCLFIPNYAQPLWVVGIIFICVIIISDFLAANYSKIKHAKKAA